MLEFCLTFGFVGGQAVRNTRIMSAFGENLRRVRAELGVSQEDLSARSGISQTQISRIETGTINTTISTLYNISKALGVSNSKLFDFELEE